LSSGQFLDLDEGDIETALVDSEKIDSYLTTRFGVTVRIPTTTYKVRCGRVWRCESGFWTETAETARLKDEVLANDLEIVNGHNAASKVAQVSENIANAQNRVEVLVSNQERMQAFGCD
jgi:phage gp36-like protein